MRLTVQTEKKDGTAERCPTFNAKGRAPEPHSDARFCWIHGHSSTQRWGSVCPCARERPSNRKENSRTGARPIIVGRRALFPETGLSLFVGLRNVCPDRLSRLDPRRAARTEVHATAARPLSRGNHPSAKIG